MTMSLHCFLLFQSLNIKYGAIATSSLGEKVLSANHSDPSMQTTGSEQASTQSNPAEGRELFPMNLVLLYYCFCKGNLWSSGRELVFLTIAHPSLTM